MALYRRLDALAYNLIDQARMGAAYELLLMQLRLQDRDDPITELIATRVIEAFEAGKQDSDDIGKYVLARLGPS
jgi:hypothetical protein